ncbi:MAG: D-alanyl-D-alanine carboxypeptidase [Alphaproteobacteria bacterium]|nr:D-alanyl-D-alanine carboxypeptidase [Alphaproteobacteria bacterium]
MPYADIVIDASTGDILHQTSSRSLRHPASLTKMMTLYLSFQALESKRLGLRERLRVSQHAASQSPSKLGLEEGQAIRVEDAILAMTTESANDAAVVLAEALGGTEAQFAKMMTAQARALGMTRTRFKNASGLPDPGQVTTARDMAILGAALIDHYPKYYPYFSQETFSYEGTVHRNHNRLLAHYTGADGIKTGYIRASGFNLVASVKRGGVRLIGVVFGGRTAKDRDWRMARLLDRSFVVAQRKTSSVRVASVDQRDDLSLPQRLSELAPSSGGHAVAVASARKATDASSWGVQIGAYSDAAVGRRVLTSLVSEIEGFQAEPDPQVQKINAGGITMYRARLMSLDKDTAQNICSYLVRQGKSCLTVQP